MRTSLKQWRQSWIQHGRVCWKSTVAETGDKSATKSTVAVYGRLCCRFWQQIGNNLNSSACRGLHCRQLDRLCRPNVERPFDFVASVYWALGSRNMVSAPPPVRLSVPIVNSKTEDYTTMGTHRNSCKRGKSLRLPFFSTPSPVSPFFSSPSILSLLPCPLCCLFSAAKRIPWILLGCLRSSVYFPSRIRGRAAAGIAFEVFLSQ